MILGIQNEDIISNIPRTIQWKTLKRYGYTLINYGYAIKYELTEDTRWIEVQSSYVAGFPDKNMQLWDQWLERQSRVIGNIGNDDDDDGKKQDDKAFKSYSTTKSTLNHVARRRNVIGLLQDSFSAEICSTQELRNSYSCRWWAAYEWICSRSESTSVWRVRRTPSRLRLEANRSLSKSLRVVDSWHKVVTRLPSAA